MTRHRRLDAGGLHGASAASRHAEKRSGVGRRVYDRPVAVPAAAYSSVEVVDRPLIGFTVADIPPAKRWMSYGIVGGGPEFAIPPNVRRGGYLRRTSTSMSSRRAVPLLVISWRAPLSKKPHCPGSLNSNVIAPDASPFPSLS